MFGWVSSIWSLSLWGSRPIDIFPKCPLLHMLGNSFYDQIMSIIESALVLDFVLPMDVK